MNGNSMSRVYCALSVKKDDIDCGLVTRLLNIRPTSITYKGQALIPGNKAVANTGIWEYSTRGHLDSADLNSHVDALINMFSGKKNQFQDLHDASYTIEMSCYVGTDSNCEVLFSRGAIEWIYEYNINNIFMDMYAFCD